MNIPKHISLFGNKIIIKQNDSYSEYIKFMDSAFNIIVNFYPDKLNEKWNSYYLISNDKFVLWIFQYIIFNNNF